VAGLALVGLLSAPLRDGARALEYWKGFQVASGRISRFLAIAPQVPVVVDDRAALHAEGLGIQGVVTDAGFLLAHGARLHIAAAPVAGRALLWRLAGLLPPDAGTVTLCGEPGRQGPMLVSPELPLMRGSLSRNLRYARPDATPEAIDAVLARCGLKDVVARLKRGIDTRLGDGGAPLDTEARVRVQLARALLAGPPLLLLDGSGAAQALAPLFDAIERDYPGAVVRLLEAPEAAAPAWTITPPPAPTPASNPPAAVAAATAPGGVAAFTAFPTPVEPLLSTIH
jgi:ABC-type transport system involved in cytochrome c biogenesis ATPase subunit